MRTLETACGFDLSEKAKFRLHVLSVLAKGGWKSVHIAFPKLSRATVYRWKKTYEQSRKKLNALVPRSTRPHRLRQMQTPLPLLKLIRSLRETYPRMGKAKLKLFVDAFCQEKGLPSLSASTIGKVIKRNHFFFARKHQGRKTPCSQKQRIKRCPKATEVQPGYIQLDGFRYYTLNRYYYFLTAVDIVTKQAWVQCAPSFTSKAAAKLLKEILASAYVPVHTIQTDNGSKFLLAFSEAAKIAGLTHLFSYPRQSKTNGYVERFNWTVQDEFVFNSEDLLVYPDEFKQALQQWLTFYHEARPHQSLGYLTPLQNFTRKETVVSNVCN
jgi:transposase InsO family protein